MHDYGTALEWIDKQIATWPSEDANTVFSTIRHALERMAEIEIIERRMGNDWISELAQSLSPIAAATEETKG